MHVQNPFSINPYTAYAQHAQQVLAMRRAGQLGPVYAQQVAPQSPFGRNSAQVGMVEIGNIAMGQVPAGAMAPAAASPVFGGFGAQPGLYPVRQVAPTELRGSALGFDQTVAASASATITSRPQQPFRPEKLVVGATGAGNFLITDIKIGNTSMLLNSTGIPAEAFTPDAVGVHLRWKTAQPAQDVVIDVTEILAAQRRFLAMMTGTVAE